MRKRPIVGISKLTIQQAPFSPCLAHNNHMSLCYTRMLPQSLRAPSP
jgi:hypothetical protein